MNNPEFAIKKYVVNHYGDLITHDKPIFDDKTKIWMARLGSTYPRIVTDDVSGEVLVGFLDLKDLGTVKLDNNFHTIHATSKKNCDDQLSSRLDLWKQQTERIVINVSSEAFAKIEESIHVLNPLELILDQLVRTVRDNEIKILDSDIHKQNNPDRIMQYLELLLELEIVRKVQDGYMHGNVYVGLLEKTNTSNNLKTLLLSYIIAKKYSTLRQVFGITQLEPYIHLANTYYSASLEAEKLIHISQSHLYQRYQNFYKTISRWAFDSKLNELVDKGALQYDNNCLVGNKEYFDNMLQMKYSVELNPITS